LKPVVLLNPAVSCVVSAGSETKEGVLPFRRVATGIASIRCWADRV
jgi:hypothetical protein